MGENLRERVQARNAPAGPAAPGAEVATVETPTIGQRISGMEPEFQKGMPRGREAAQIVRDALTALRTTRNLERCEPMSVLGAVMTCAQLGLRIGVLGHAWVLPFWDKNLVSVDERGVERKGGYKAQFIIGYQGLVDLAYRSGKVASLIARPVYENETFEVEYGLSDKLVHKPIIKGTRGAPIAYYAVTHLTTGGHAFYVMSHDEMLEYRDEYATAKNQKGQIVGPWRDHFEDMALKTTVRQLSKWMPKSTDFASAIEADGTVRVDLNPNPDALLHGTHPDTVDGEIVDEGTETGDSQEDQSEAATA